MIKIQGMMFHTTVINVVKQ